MPIFRTRTRERSRGQSLVEFTLVLPVILLLTLIALDFGRIYLGYVNAQQMARIAANYAANNATLLAPGPNQDADIVDEYRRLVSNDARLINCGLPGQVPEPQYTLGTELGDPVLVSIPCQFRILTPIIGTILGDDVLLTASATFPIKQGAVTEVNNGTPVEPPPVAAFLATPRSGYAPLEVSFFDISENQPTLWVWDFGDGSSSNGVKNPTHTYADPGPYEVTLTVTNGGGSDTETRVAYINVLAPPTVGPVPEFEADQLYGPKPLTVEFTDLSTGDPDTWLWTFGDGAATSGEQNPTYTYQSAGVYDVTLTVTSADGTNSQTKTGYILVSQFPCIVPNFANTSANSAQTTWNDAGFTTTVQKLRNGNFTIRYQSLPGGLESPPNGCDAVIAVGP